MWTREVPQTLAPGRQRLLGEAVRALRARQHVVAVGHTYAGKTVFLRALDAACREAGLTVVYLVASLLETEEEFWETMARQVGLLAHGLSWDGDRYEVLRAMMPDALVVIVDDLDRLWGWGEEFFRRLRTLCLERSLTLVASMAPRGVEDFRRLVAVSLSWVQYLDLNQYGPEEARALLATLDGLVPAHWPSGWKDVVASTARLRAPALHVFLDVARERLRVSGDAAWDDVLYAWTERLPRLRGARGQEKKATAAARRRSWGWMRFLFLVLVVGGLLGSLARLWN